MSLSWQSRSEKNESSKPSIRGTRGDNGERQIEMKWPPRGFQQG